MQQDNPAVLRQTEVPPSLLEELDNDPKLLSSVAKRMLLVRMDAMYRTISTSNTSMGQQQQFIDFLAKIADAYPKANAVPVTAPGQGFSVNIIMNAPSPAGLPQTKPVVTIEAESGEAVSTTVAPTNMSLQTVEMFAPELEPDPASLPVPLTPTADEDWGSDAD